MHSLRLQCLVGSSLRIAAFVAVVAVFSGCRSIPPEVAKLSREASAKTAELGAAYASDLDRFAAYDERRSQQFAAAYERLRGQIAPLRAKELEARKAMVKAELLARFDQEAETILTRDFWLQYRAGTSAADAIRLLEQISEADGRVKNAVAHQNDQNARNTAIAELRKIQLLESGLNAALVSAFARTAQAVAAKRRDFVVKIEQEFEKITLPKPGEAPNLDSLPDSSSVLMARAQNVRATYVTLTKAQDQLTRYLTTEDKELAKSFVEGMIENVTNLQTPAPDAITAAADTTNTGAKGAEGTGTPKAADKKPLDIVLGALLGENPSLDTKLEKAKSKLGESLPGILEQLRKAIPTNAQP